MEETNISEEYKKAAKEIIELMKTFPVEKVNKIPKNMLAFFEEIALENYEPHFDFTKDISELELTETTRDILSIFYKNYWSENNQENNYETIDINNEEQKDWVNQNDVKSNFQENNEQNQSEEITNLPTIVKEPNIIQRIINFFKRLFFKEKRSKYHENKSNGIYKAGVYNN